MPVERSDTSFTLLYPVTVLALALSLGAALSLGITRFAYGLLLPPMRLDLGWSYTLAGAMNTVNAFGYLVGALCTPRLLQRWRAGQVLLVGALLATLFMAGSGFFIHSIPLLVQRFLAGFASALVFVSGGLLAARLGAQVPGRSGFLLGLYYGGTGFGIVLSALAVPYVLEWAAEMPHGWAWAWWALSLACLLSTVVLAWPARVLDTLPVPSVSLADAGGRTFKWKDFSFALTGYGLFGVGYIGYMTFVIALLRERGASSGSITVFYALLGVSVLASSRIWAGLLDRYKGGQVLALLNGLLGLATILPALTNDKTMVLVSGVLFGAVFLSVVASTTTLVRHNLPQMAWASGISGFTIIFAAGQIIGPTVVGKIADGPGGLASGLVYSAAALWLGAFFAWRQRPL